MDKKHLLSPVLIYKPFSSIRRVQQYFFIFFLVFGISSASYAEYIHQDVVYAQYPGVAQSRLSLDIYAPKDTVSIPFNRDMRPVMIFAHGGQWFRGDKSGSSMNGLKNVMLKAGFIFVSINYRLSPQWLFPTHSYDASTAIAWIQNNISKYGGDGDRIVLAGHSSGAQIMAYVGVRPEMIVAAGGNPSAIKGVVPLDGTCYDVEDGLARNTGTKYEIPFKNAFGDSPEQWRESSCIAHVYPGKPIPAFLFVHAQADSFESEMFVSLLLASGVDVFAVRSPTSHAGVLTGIGGKGDEIGEAIVHFSLSACRE